MLEQTVIVTLALFVLGLTYAAGRQATRLDHLEQWRLEIRADVTAIFDILRRLEQLILKRDA